MKTWRIERTHWRDSALSERHGCWGFNCPAVDLDFVVVEYNYGKPCAIVEYKHKNATAPNTRHATYRALIALADGYTSGPLPCFVATYDPENWSFRVLALNDCARRHYGFCEGETLTEQRFVKSLHLLRKSVLTQEDHSAIAQLNAATRSESVE
tara:strand:+ start:912 stop:1373 length:462 start_codon:yes stop_codon:yes gene_type:complete